MTVSVFHSALPYMDKQRSAREYDPTRIGIPYILPRPDTHTADNLICVLAICQDLSISNIKTRRVIDANIYRFGVCSVCLGSVPLSEDDVHQPFAMFEHQLSSLSIPLLRIPIEVSNNVDNLLRFTSGKMHEDNSFVAGRDWKVCFHLEGSQRDGFASNIGWLLFTDWNIGKGVLLQNVLK